MGALPPPAAWPELARTINARNAKDHPEGEELGLQFLAAALLSDTNARNSAITNLQSKIKDNGDPETFMYRNYLQELSQSMQEMSDDPDAVLKTLNQQLNPANGNGMGMIAVPNLVVLVGPEKAEQFLRKALVQPGMHLNFGEPNETTHLAQKLALELVDKLSSPPWELVNSLDAVDLYEALDKHFNNLTNTPAAVSLPGLPGLSNSEMTAGFGENFTAQAKVYYLLGLIAHDRAKDAVVVAKKLGGLNQAYVPEHALEQMDEAGYTSALDNFFYELLSHDPSLTYWGEYVPLAAKAGQTDRMLKLARAAAENDALNERKKVSIRQNLVSALLAADQVDEAVKEIRALIALDSPPPSENNFGQEMTKADLGLTLTRVGVLMNKPDWAQEGISVVKTELAKPVSGNAMTWNLGANAGAAAELLVRMNRGPEAEELLQNSLAQAVKLQESQQQESMYGNLASGQALKKIAALYHKAGRESDVITLLQQSPDWGEDDLSKVTGEDFSAGEFGFFPGHHIEPLPLEYLAANALLAGGQRDQAAKIVDDLLNTEPGLDRGYELLISLQGTNAIGRLDELFARDQFEERPLIWKAHLLRQLNQFEEAEKVVRKAIAIDPSDGEEGRGDRMRAYSELAEIREARGDKKEANFYREVVKAIRLSEDADQFYSAGLLKHAIAMYEEGLTHFSDAYCIQSRLAIQLSALGQTQAAEEHYRRAYELMPDSFGRVESHCFGCERVFEGESAQSIAEKVFSKLAVEQPYKPQVHYLLGYLREEQQRMAEARTNYLAATQLDPDYLNAWVHRDIVSHHVRTSPKESDDITFNLLRLDPLQRHQQLNFSKVSDLKALWAAVDAASRKIIPPATNLFTLTASKAALEKKKNNKPAQQAYMQIIMDRRDQQSQLSPGVAISQTPFVRLASELIMGGNSWQD
jgi:tetratricopeptide (TPR) repeat protein